MRKTGFLFLSILFTVALAGCAKDGGKEASETTAAAVTSEAVTTAAPTAAPETEKSTEAVKETAAAGETTKAEVTEAAETTAAETESEETSEAVSEAADGNPKENPAPAGSPDDGILLSFADEKAFLASDYPDIPLHGSATEEETYQLVEALADMLSVKAAEAGITEDYIYGDCTTEVLWPDEEKGARIVETYLSAGNPLMDEVMHREGYTDYHLTYYYPRQVWIPAGEEQNAPVLADLWIGNDEYQYFFLNGELVRRDGPDGESLNPETNRFMNSVYKLGCYYGNVVDKPRDRYYLFITSMEQITEQDGSYMITCNIQGRDKPWSFTVDADTDFSADCETVSFSGYRAGESGYEWYRRAYETLSAEDFDEDYDGGSEFTMTALVGIFEIQASGSHVDELCGCYWWD